VISAPDLTYVSRDLEGVRGWLLLFVIGQIGVVLVQLLGLPAAWAPFTNGSLDLAGQFILLGPLLVVEFLAHVAQIVLPAVGLTLIFRRSRYAPAFWVSYLLLLVGYAVLDVVGTQVVFSQMTEVFGTEALGTAQTEISAARITNLRLGFAATLWAAYWIKSERVAVTFKRSAV
jgi:hypothetical protein